MQTIRSAGLVLVADLSDGEYATSQRNTNSSGKDIEPPDGVDGYVRKDGILKFHEFIEM